MTRFEEIGVSFQYSARSSGEAAKVFKKSCDRCCKCGFRVSCDRCAIATAHDIALTVFQSHTERRVLTHA